MVGREKYVAAIGEKLQLHSTFKYLRHKIPNRHITNHGIVNHTTLSGFVSVFVHVSVCVCVCVCVCVRVHVCARACVHAYVCV